jgi:TonB family protein
VYTPDISMRSFAVGRRPPEDVFSIGEIARAAGVPSAKVEQLLGRPPGRPVRYVGRHEAIRIVRALTIAVRNQPSERAPLTLVADVKRRQGLPLLVSGTFHLLVIGSLVLLTPGLFEARPTEQAVEDPRPTRLVFLMTAGPGGGGGGGGLQAPLPPARAERRAPRKTSISSPAPPRRETPPPRPPAPDPPRPEPPKINPPPIEPPKIDPPEPEPLKLEPPRPPPQSLVAPVVPAPADAASLPGLLDALPAKLASAGPGTGAGVGSGTGTGIGEGRGAGLGPGSGGGTGGGPFRAGAGIEPPTLLREVKPLYTDEARRQSIEGDVLLEVVVRRDGTVGSMRVLRRLGAGLDERAMEAVRQWRFSPARRYGSPVDVIVDVAVEFTLR